MVQEGLREGHALVLVGRAVRGCEPDLRQGVLEAGVFGGLRVAHVGGEIPVRFLRDLGYYEAA